MASMSIKRGCQRSFVTKQPYFDHSICPLIHLHAKHKNKMGELCHEKKNLVEAYETSGHVLTKKFRKLLEQYDLTKKKIPMLNMKGLISMA